MSGVAVTRQGQQRPFRNVRISKESHIFDRTPRKSLETISRPAVSKTVFVLHGMGNIKVWQSSPSFARARGELANVAVEAADEGYPVPSQVQIDRADDLLRKLFKLFPAEYTVYPTPQSEIAIDLTTDDMSIVVYCHANGAAECFVDTDDSQSHAWYRNSEEVLGAFLQDALSKLPPSSSPKLQQALLWYEDALLGHER